MWVSGVVSEFLYLVLDVYTREAVIVGSCAIVGRLAVVIFDVAEVDQTESSLLMLEIEFLTVPLLLVIILPSVSQKQTVELLHFVRTVAR